MKLPSDMSVDAFLNWVPAQDGRKWQLIDGEPRAMSPARLVHKHLQNKLGGLIEAHLRASGRNCDVFANPVSCAPYALNQVAITDPVAIVEILSPTNRMDTWSNVWAYTSIPTVQDILVLRADAIGGDLLRRLPNGMWPDRPAPVVDELALKSIGFQVALADLYARTPLMTGS